MPIPVPLRRADVYWAADVREGADVRAAAGPSPAPLRRAAVDVRAAEDDVREAADVRAAEDVRMGAGPLRRAAVDVCAATDVRVAAGPLRRAAADVRAPSDVRAVAGGLSGNTYPPQGFVIRGAKQANLWVRARPAPLASAVSTTMCMDPGVAAAMLPCAVLSSSALLARSCWPAQPHLSEPCQKLVCQLSKPRTHEKKL